MQKACGAEDFPSSTSDTYRRLLGIVGSFDYPQHQNTVEPHNKWTQSIYDIITDQNGNPVTSEQGVMVHRHAACQGLTSGTSQTQNPKDSETLIISHKAPWKEEV